MSNGKRNPDSEYKPLIFIAEDIPKNLQVLCNILKKENFRIAAAGNGRQALEMIPNAKPDLILLDVMMPEMDGFEVCRRLQEQPHLKEIPIIFLTAKAEKSDVVKGFEIGAVDYVTKPFNGAELLSRVKSHLELKLAREELKNLNATKDKFFSIIAHDLKDPLQCLLLYAESLYNYYDTFGEEKRKDYINRFYINTHQISALLENLLTWSRSHGGKIECRPEPTDIRLLVEENFGLINESASKKSISFILEVPTGTLVLADQNMIRTVLRNLLSNAVKFTRSGGTVKITVTTGKEALTKKEWVYISVSDNGVGISRENLDGLFRLDMQKSTLGTAREKGTGLGLILCKEFVEKNNGELQVTSEVGKGSCFTVVLPAA